jgi:hypothetical protein
MSDITNCRLCKGESLSRVIVFPFPEFNVITT